MKHFLSFYMFTETCSAKWIRHTVDHISFIQFWIFKKQRKEKCIGIHLPVNDLAFTIIYSGIQLHFFTHEKAYL